MEHVLHVTTQAVVCLSQFVEVNVCKRYQEVGVVNRTGTPSL